MVPMAWIEHATSPLPRECSATELHGRKIALLPCSRRETGAGEGNRTLVVSLEGFCSTIELHPPGIFENSLPSSRESTHPLQQHLPGAPVLKNLVEGEGFEPSKAEPTDLQSAPFDRSGTPPNETGNYRQVPPECQRIGHEKCWAPGPIGSWKRHGSSHQAAFIHCVSSADRAWHGHAGLVCTAADPTAGIGLTAACLINVSAN